MTGKINLFVVATLILLFIGLVSSQDRVTDTNTASGMDLTNAGAPQAAILSNNESVSIFSEPTGEFTPEVGLETVADGLVAPMVALSPDDGTGRLFIVDQIGVVRVLDAEGNMMEEPFLDVRDRMVDLNPGYDERGLLSIALHPDFENSSRIYAFYSAPLREGAPEGWDSTNHLSEFTISEDTGMADMDSERVLMQIDKPQANHNGGMIRFGPDGYLYVPLGDGGAANDTGLGHTPGIGNAQDMTKILGKMLRIDVDTTTDDRPYGIPDDNPFLDNSSIPSEIYASGFRNPAFMSFDAETGMLFVGNAGQELFETVYAVVRGGNYGWNIREGTHCFDPNNNRVPPENCSITGSNGEPLIGPIIELGHDVGEVIVGGYVYRGSAVPELQGRYIFGAWSGDESANRTLLVATPPADWKWNIDNAEGLNESDAKAWDTMVLKVPANANQGVDGLVRGFGEDSDGEIYVLTSDETGPSGTTGRVSKIVPADAMAARQD